MGIEQGVIPESELYPVFSHTYGEPYDEVYARIEEYKRELMEKYGNCRGVLSVIVENFSKSVCVKN